jgi:hypothetical protein
VFLIEVASAMEKFKVPFVVVGGYALALHGIVRATMDVDFVIHLTEGNLQAAENALNSVGLQSRIPVRASDVYKFRKEYIEKRNLLAWSFADFKNPTRQVDILIDVDKDDLEVVKISVGGHKIPVVSLRSLQKMKEKAGRPQDLVDVQNIKEVLDGKKR